MMIQQSPLRTLYVLICCGLTLSFISCTQASRLEQAEAIVKQVVEQENPQEKIATKQGTTINASELKAEVALKAKESFRPETLYATLLAEIALDRGMPDVALNSYRKEAVNTRDPGVIKRALEISTWMEVHQVSLELMSLWQEVEPTNPKAHEIMAQQQLYFGLVKGALVSIQKVLDLGGQFNFDLFNQVAPKLNESERLETLRTLEKMSKDYPENSQIWLSLSNFYSLLDQRQSALNAAQVAMRLDENDDRPVVMHAELRFNYFDQHSALKEMEKGLKKFPHSKQLNFLYLQSLLKLSKNKKAERQIYKTLERFPDQPELRFQIALVSADFKLNSVAKDLFGINIEEEYRPEESRFHLSRIAETEGDFSAAINYLQVIKPGVGFAEARLQIAYLLAEQNKVDEAIVSLQEARVMQAQSKDIFYHAEADFLIQENKKAQAMEVFGEAIKEYPNVIKLRYARSLLAESMNNLSLAESDLLKVIEMEPRNAMALNALGYTLTNKTDRHQEALVYIKKAYEISPNDPAIIDSMGWVNYRLGNYPEALKYLRKAISIEPDHEIAAHLGEVLWVSGLEVEAKRVWEEALEKSSGSEVLKSVMEKFIRK